MSKSPLLGVVVLAGVVVAALSLAPPGRAAEKAAKPKGFSGAVVSVDATAGTLVARRITATIKVSRTFKVDEHTKFVAADNKPFGLADLKAGEKITVLYTEQGKELTAVEVALAPVGKRK